MEKWEAGFFHSWHQRHEGSLLQPPLPQHQQWAGTAFSQYISSAVESQLPADTSKERLSAISKQPASEFDAYKAGNSREGTSQRSTKGF